MQSENSYIHVSDDASELAKGHFFRLHWLKSRQTGKDVVKESQS